MVSENTKNAGEGDNSKFQDDKIGFSTQFMDTKIDPWKDFFSYCSGNWVRNNPVPEDKSQWGAFGELVEKNNKLLKGLLDDLTPMASKTVDQDELILSEFYKSGMDTERIEELKFQPIMAYIEDIEKVTSIDQLNECLVRLHREGISSFFNTHSEADEKNSKIYAMYFSQGGLTLPDRDFYLEDSHSELRGQYKDHIRNMFVIYGLERKIAESCSNTIMALETRIAKASRTSTELRDAEKNYNRIETKDLATKYQNLSLVSYMQGLEVTQTPYIVARQPEFLQAIDKMLRTTNIEDLKLLLKWNVLWSNAPFMFSELRDEHFDFFNRKAQGQEKPEPRWKLVIRTIDHSIGEALGKLYVKNYFNEEARKRMALMIEDIQNVFRRRLKALPWMTEETKENALVKFDKFRAKIGHPDKFRDYSSLKIDKKDYLGNIRRAAAFEINREAKRVGSDVDKSEWHMTPSSVNAYFSPPDNEIVFPAGILQPPFFDPTMDVAVNYGGIGAVISHEITHGYDDQGRKYDENGNLRDWWSSADQENFNGMAASVAKVYSSLEALPGRKVNGELTLGENIADIGGINIAYEALQARLEREPELRKVIDGFTPEQRFFISWGQVWRENIREQLLKILLTVDPHSPNRFRASIPVYNHIDFEKAFPVKGESSSLPIEKKVTIW